MNILAEAVLPQILNPCLEKKESTESKLNFLRYLLAYIHSMKMGLLCHFNTCT